MKEINPSRTTRKSGNSGSQEVEEEGIEITAAQEVTAKDGDSISKVSHNFETDSGVPEHDINGNTEDNVDDEDIIISGDENDSNDGIEDIKSTSKRKYQTKYQKRQEKIEIDEHKKEKFAAAIKDMKEMKYKSIRSCAKAHGVPRSSLQRFLNDGTEYVGIGNKLTEFTRQEELRLKEHIVRVLQLGFGVTVVELQLIFQECMAALLEADVNRTTKWEDCLPPYQWCYNFTIRHGLSLRSSMELSKARSVISPESLKMWQRDTYQGRLTIVNMIYTI